MASTTLAERLLISMQATMLESYYRTLEISPNATKAEVRLAFRELLQVWHPDRYCDNPHLKQRAEQKTKEIICAYEAILFHLTKPPKVSPPKDSSSAKNYGQALSPEIKPHFSSDFLAGQTRYGNLAHSQSRTLPKRQDRFLRDLLSIPGMILKLPFMIIDYILQFLMRSRLW